MGEIDQAYIQAPEHRPNRFIIQAEGIPVIDLSSIIQSRNIDISQTFNQNLKLSETSDKNLKLSEKIVGEIGRACEEWGFFQVINHGVSSERREKLELAARKFFALPIEEKKKVKRDESNPMGYYDIEHTKNVRDWKEVFDFTVEIPTVIPASDEPDDLTVINLVNQWPDHPSELRTASEEYIKEVEKLSITVLELISLSLGLQANRLNGYFKDQTTFIRLNHYPACPNPQLALGVGRHKDAGAMTILTQDHVGGLEVKRKSDGEWIRVKPTPNAFIVNIGDIIQVWSNDKYESVEHRVMVNSEQDRLSIPFFVNPSHYTMVEPLEELITEQNPARYKKYNWGKFFSARKRSNFKKLDVENIQVSHFKV